MILFILLGGNEKVEICFEKQEVTVAEVVREFNSMKQKRVVTKNEYEKNPLDIYNYTILLGTEILGLNSVLRDSDEIIILPVLGGG